MHYVYIIYSPKYNKHYTGSTENLEKRLSEHNRNITHSTKHRGPWEVIYKEGFETKCAAIKKERYIKSLKGGNAFKKLIQSSPSSSLA